MADEPDLDQPGRPKIIISEAGEEVEVEQTLRDNILSLWEGLGSPEPPDISREALISDGIPYAAYEAWRLEIEDVKRRDAEVLADAATATARDDELRAQGMEPMPPSRTPEEIAAIEQRQQEAEERERRHRERADESEWEGDDS